MDSGTHLRIVRLDLRRRQALVPVSPLQATLSLCDNMRQEEKAYGIRGVFRLYHDTPLLEVDLAEQLLAGASTVHACGVDLRDRTSIKALTSGQEIVVVADLVVAVGLE